jgi:hypothetical protein
MATELTVCKNWRGEFARVVSCSSCSILNSKILLRDDAENVPQPGYIGPQYRETGLLLVGQNPAVPPDRLAFADRIYTAALRAIRNEPTEEVYDTLQSILADFIPQWPVHGEYFPLAECGLSLDDIAYFNLVRCRTVNNSDPGGRIASKCIQEHFTRWLNLLAPRVVIFVGKWAHDKGSRFVSAMQIPYSYINRQRSLSSSERKSNRAEVVALVRNACNL